MHGKYAKITVSNSMHNSINGGHGVFRNSLRDYGEVWRDPTRVDSRGKAPCKVVARMKSFRRCQHFTTTHFDSNSVTLTTGQRDNSYKLRADFVCCPHTPLLSHPLYLSTPPPKHRFALGVGFRFGYTREAAQIETRE